MTVPRSTSFNNLQKLKASDFEAVASKGMEKLEKACKGKGKAAGKGAKANGKGNVQCRAWASQNTTSAQ